MIKRRTKCPKNKNRQAENRFRAWRSYFDEALDSMREPREVKHIAIAEKYADAAMAAMAKHDPSYEGSPPSPAAELQSPIRFEN